jgi:hypothetical protein
MGGEAVSIQRSRPYRFAVAPGGLERGCTRILLQLSTVLLSAIGFALPFQLIVGKRLTLLASGYRAIAIH